VAPLPRRPGERGQRYAHLLEGEQAAPAPATATQSSSEDGIGQRVERLEGEVAALREELEALRSTIRPPSS
jgi:uncharacterized protein YceH (UPF0502 family)